jgi:hypothetical protein
VAGFPIARLRYTAAGKSWTLYWRDRNLRFHIYDLIAPSSHVNDLLDEIDRDPTCIFWGEAEAGCQPTALGLLRWGQLTPGTVGPDWVDIAKPRYTGGTCPRLIARGHPSEGPPIRTRWATSRQPPVSAARRA